LNTFSLAIVALAHLAFVHVTLAAWCKGQSQKFQITSFAEKLARGIAHLLSLEEGYEIFQIALCISFSDVLYGTCGTYMAKNFHK